MARTKVLLLQLDGKGPNLALMRLAAHHRSLGHEVDLRHAPTVGAVERRLGDAFDRVYASTIFERTRPVVERLRLVYPDAIVGGTGWDLATTLESVSVPTLGPLDYSDYPTHRESIGFTQRGCRLRCRFCVVPRKEGRPRPEATILDIWRGEPWPRWVLLLDNDFFGTPGWEDRIEEVRSGKFRVCFNQGINSRMLTDEAAAAIASVDYRDDSFKARRIYTAWDNLKDEDKLFRGLESLVRHGVMPDHIMVYMLIGYDHETDGPRPYLTEGDFRRHRRLREFGCRPYPMPFVRTPQLVGFQRWCVRRVDLEVPWEEFEAAAYRPERFRPRAETPLFVGEEVG